MSEDDRLWFEAAQLDLQDSAIKTYEEALNRGIAKEQARFLLPINAKTRLYMNGTVRSWLHYLKLRCGNGTQKEHMDIAKEIRDNIFIKEFPIISEAMEWKKLDNEE